MTLISIPIINRTCTTKTMRYILVLMHCRLPPVRGRKGIGMWVSQYHFSVSPSTPQVRRHGPGMPFIDPSWSILRSKIEYTIAYSHYGQGLQFDLYKIKEHAVSYLNTVISTIISNKNNAPLHPHSMSCHSNYNTILVECSTTRVSHIRRKILLRTFIYVPARPRFTVTSNGGN